MKDILTSPVKSQMPKFEVGKSVCAPYSRLRNLGKEVHVRIREFARVFAINDGILSFVNEFPELGGLSLRDNMSNKQARPEHIRTKISTRGWFVFELDFMFRPLSWKS
jgi:hypothetical protein